MELRDATTFGRDRRRTPNCCAVLVARGGRGAGLYRRCAGLHRCRVHPIWDRLYDYERPLVRERAEGGGSARREAHQMPQASLQLALPETVTCRVCCPGSCYPSRFHVAHCLAYQWRLSFATENVLRLMNKLIGLWYIRYSDLNQSIAY